MAISGEAIATPVRDPGFRRLDRPTDAVRLGEVQPVRRGSQVSRPTSVGHGHVFGVLTGALRTCRVLMDGRRQVMAFLFPGDWCWLEERLGHPTTVEAITDSQIVRVPRHQLSAANCEGGGVMQQILHASLTAALDRNVTLGQKSARDKLAAFLLDLSNRLADGRSEIALPMSRYDIAEYLGLRSETVCRTFAQLAADGVIALPEPQRIRIRDRAALELVLS